MQFVQVLGVPGADVDDLGLIWKITEVDGQRMEFKLNFTNPIKIS